MRYVFQRTELVSAYLIMCTGISAGRIAAVKMMTIQEGDPLPERERRTTRVTEKKVKFRNNKHKLHSFPVLQLGLCVPVRFQLVHSNILGFVHFGRCMHFRFRAPIHLHTVPPPPSGALFVDLRIVLVPAVRRLGRGRGLHARPPASRRPFVRSPAPYADPFGGRYRSAAAGGAGTRAARSHQVSRLSAR